MGIVTWLIWGLFVGALARLLLPGRHSIGIAMTLILGIVGSLLGGFVATEALGIADSDEADFGSFVIAVISSVALLAVYSRVSRILPDLERGRDLTTRRPTP